MSKISLAFLFLLFLPHSNPSESISCLATRMAEYYFPFPHAFDHFISRLGVSSTNSRYINLRRKYSTLQSKFVEGLADLDFCNGNGCVLSNLVSQDFNKLTSETGYCSFITADLCTLEYMFRCELKYFEILTKTLWDRPFKEAEAEWRKFQKSSHKVRNDIELSADEMNRLPMFSQRLHIAILDIVTNVNLINFTMETMLNTLDLIWTHELYLYLLILLYFNTEYFSGNDIIFSYSNALQATMRQIDAATRYAFVHYTKKLRKWTENHVSELQAIPVVNKPHILNSIRTAARTPFSIEVFPADLVKLLLESNEHDKDFFELIDQVQLFHSQLAICDTFQCMLRVRMAPTTFFNDSVGSWFENYRLNILSTLWNYEHFHMFKSLPILIQLVDLERSYSAHTGIPQIVFRVLDTFRNWPEAEKLAATFFLLCIHHSIKSSTFSLYSSNDTLCNWELKINEAYSVAIKLRSIRLLSFLSNSVVLIETTFTLHYILAMCFNEKFIHLPKYNRSDLSITECLDYSVSLCFAIKAVVQMGYAGTSSGTEPLMKAMSVLFLTEQYIRKWAFHVCPSIHKLFFDYFQVDAKKFLNTDGGFLIKKC